MKKILSVIAMLVAVVGVTACSYEPIQGVITDKDTYYTTTTTKVGDVPIVQTHKKYRLTVEYGNGEGGTETTRWTVKRSVYEACETGNGIDRTEDGTITCFLR